MLKLARAEVDCPAHTFFVLAHTNSTYRRGYRLLHRSNHILILLQMDM